jgi:hypothetical protein
MAASAAIVAIEGKAFAPCLSAWLAIEISTSRAASFALLWVMTHDTAWMLTVRPRTATSVGSDVDPRAIDLESTKIRRQHRQATSSQLREGLCPARS